MRNWSIYLSIFFILSCSIFTFNSCEYDSDNSFYYLGVEKPKDIKVDINLANVNPDDTIYIYASTRLYFSISGEGKKIVNQEFHLDGATIVQDSNYILITPDEIDGRNHILSYDVTFKTGSGSIADITGNEVYEGHYKYILKYISDAKLDLNLRQSITPDGYLKLEWDKPNLKQTEITGYELSFTNTNDITTSSVIYLDPSTNSFIDHNYAYGYKLYKLKVCFADDRIDTWQSYHTAEYTPINNKDWNIEEDNTDGLNISWKKNDFNCNYILELPDGRTINCGKNTSTSIKRDAFPIKYSLFKLYILPEGQNSTSDANETNIVGYWYGSPTLLNGQYKFISDDNYIYAISNSSIKIYDTWLNYIEEKSIYPTIDLNTDKIFYSYTSGERARIISQSGNNFYIYNYNNRYQNPIQIEGPGYTNYIVASINSNTNKLQVIPNKPGLNFVYIYDLSNIIIKDTLSLNFVTPSLITMSTDGKTIVEVNENLVYKHNYSSICIDDKISIDETIQYLEFDKTDNTKLVGSTTSNYLMNINSDMKSTISNTNLIYVTQDYYNGNIIAKDKDYTSNSYIYIVDKMTYQIVGKFRANITDYEIKMYNYNMILSNSHSSYKINIKKYCN